MLYFTFYFLHSTCLCYSVCLFFLAVLSGFGINKSYAIVTSDSGFSLLMPIVSMHNTYVEQYPQKDCSKRCTGARMYVSVCVCARETVCVCVRARETLCVCVCAREAVYVCVRARERQSVCV